jgi:alpha-glucosidase
MEYEFPHCGYENVKDQFMLGSDVLVAPVMEQGAVQRLVVLPKGEWLYCDGKEYEGDGTVVVSAPVERLPYFTRKA